ncbi:MAG TPA: hypothetical protein VGC04_15125 [Cellulomonas sp.]
MAVDPRFDRSVRRWLWAYPRRWRWTRADEMVGTLADLATPGATRLDLRSGVGLVVHGLVARRRMRPPLRVRRRYRWLNGVVPAQYRGWVADDIASPLFQWGPMLAVVTMELVWAVFHVVGGSSEPGELVWWLVLLMAALVMPKNRTRRQAASRHLVARPGDLPTVWDQQPTWVYRDRLTARSIVPTVAAGAAVAVAPAAVLTVLGRSGHGVALLVCLAIGLSFAAHLTLRWRRQVPVRGPQPARNLIVADARWAVAVWCWSVFVLLAVVPWTAPLSRLGLGLAPVVLGAGLLVLPALVCGALLSRRAPDDLAAIDVWWLAWSGPLPVDALQRSVVPASFTLRAPEGYGEAPPLPPTSAPA